MVSRNLRNPSKTAPATGYNYGKANFNQIRDMLQEVDWDNKLKDLNVSETWEMITELINKAIDTCIPRFSHAAIKKETQILEPKGLKTKI